MWQFIQDCFVYSGQIKSLFETSSPPRCFEIILNVVLFVPLGFFWGIQSSKWPKTWQWLSALILGVCLSATIELLQYSFKKGCVEVDDVIHNTLGCMIGFVLLRGCAKWFFGSKSYINL